MYTGGYTGKVLRINLTDRTWNEEPLREDMAADFIGGAGFCIKYIYDEVGPHADPLGPDNKLIYAPGPLTGTSVPCTSRMAIGALSPLTGGANVGLTGGHFPNEMKAAGYDAFIIEGQSAEPVYVWIKGAEVRFRPAGELWGMTTSDCQQAIKDELKDQNVRVSCIGPAGENLSKIASIVNERRVVGRRGFGAVMGSKNLKAIALRGNGRVPIADEVKFAAARKNIRDLMKNSPVLYPAFSKVGTSMLVEGMCAVGVFPAKNFTATGAFTPDEEIGSGALGAYGAGRMACAGCPVACSQMRLAQDGLYAGVLAEGPEYETLYSYGGMTGVDNADAIIAADRLSDEYGIDTISAGATIAFAMELWERGILTAEDTGGMDLSFGQKDSMVRLIPMMAQRQGIGDILADGSREAAKKIGKGTEKYAMHVKGLEFPGYDPRGAMAMAMNYATCYAGADHNKGFPVQELLGTPIPKEFDRFAYEEKGWLAAYNQDMATGLSDSATMCVFPVLLALAGVATETVSALLDAATGIPFRAEDIKVVGERTNNLARVYNTLVGFTRADDDLPERIKTEPLSQGAASGHSVPQEAFDSMLDEYYDSRGWTREGIPGGAKLRELGLEYAAAKLGVAK